MMHTLSHTHTRHLSLSLSHTHTRTRSTDSGQRKSRKQHNSSKAPSLTHTKLHALEHALAYPQIVAATRAQQESLAPHSSSSTPHQGPQLVETCVCAERLVCVQREVCVRISIFLERLVCVERTCVCVERTCVRVQRDVCGCRERDSCVRTERGVCTSVSWLVRADTDLSCTDLSWLVMPCACASLSACVNLCACVRVYSW